MHYYPAFFTYTYTYYITYINIYLMTLTCMFLLWKKKRSRCQCLYVTWSESDINAYRLTTFVYYFVFKFYLFTRMLWNTEVFIYLSSIVNLKLTSSLKGTCSSCCCLLLQLFMLLLEKKICVCFFFVCNLLFFHNLCKPSVHIFIFVAFCKPFIIQTYASHS